MIRAAAIAFGLLAQSATAQGVSAGRVVDTCGGTRIAIDVPQDTSAQMLDGVQAALGTRIQNNFPSLLDYTSVQDGQIIISMPDGLGTIADIPAQLVPFSMGFHDVVASGPVESLAAGDGQLVASAQDDGTRGYVIAADPVLDTSAIADAQQVFDSGLLPAVSFRFTRDGAAQFARFTADNIGAPFAIVVNGEIVSAPVIRDVIAGGSGMLSGDFTVEEATRLALSMRGGFVPDGLETASITRVDGSDPSADFCP